MYNKFEVGDTVKVVNRYNTYSYMRNVSEGMGLTYWKEGKRVDEGVQGKVIAVANHPTKPRVLYGVQTQDGYQYIIGERGLEKVEAEKEELVELGRSLFGSKMRVTPETSKLVQEAVLAAGGLGWDDGLTTKVRYRGKHFLFISEAGELGYSSSTPVFRDSVKKEVKVYTKAQLVVEEVEDDSKILGELSNAQKELEKVQKQIEHIKSKLNTNQ